MRGRHIGQVLSSVIDSDNEAVVFLRLLKPMPHLLGDVQFLPMATAGPKISLELLRVHQRFL